MTELDPNNILSSGKWAGGFKEEKEKLLVAMHNKFSKVASRQVNLDQFKKFLCRVRSDYRRAGTDKKIWISSKSAWIQRTAFHIQRKGVDETNFYDHRKAIQMDDDSRGS